jgi:hypothetical protein
LCNLCNKEYIKPYLKRVNKGLITAIAGCPYCKTLCIDERTGLSNKTQLYIGDDLNGKK